MPINSKGLLVFIKMVLMVGLFFLGAAFLRCVLIPVLWAVSSSSELFQLRVRHSIRILSKLFFCLLAIVRLARISSSGDIPKEGPLLIAANHPTLLDSLLLLSIFPNAVCVAKPALQRTLLFGGILKNAGFIFSEEAGTNAITSCLEALRSGISVIVFPEGTRTDPLISVGAFKPGLAALMARSQVVTVPAAIRCSPRMFYKRQRLVTLATEFELSATLCDAISIDVKSPSLSEERRLRPLLTSHIYEKIFTALR